MRTSTRVLGPPMGSREAREIDALLDRLVAEYADRVASGRGSEVGDLLAQVPEDRRVEVRRLFDLVDAAGGSAGVNAPRPLGPGVELGGCRILGELGRGGMATVYRAEQKALRREVALKVLRPGLAFDPTHAERFRREALAVARLDHRNVVKIHDVGSDAGHLFLVMERIEGRNLAQALADLPEPARRTGSDLRRALGLAPGDAVTSGSSPQSFELEAADFFATVARAVAAAHARGIVHRDLKPSNLLVRRDGSPVVADFGLAKGEGDLGVSLTGEPLGTPYYMSPEQVEQHANRVDARTDVYSLGVTMYEVLGGRRPFEGPTTIAVFDAIRRDEPRPLRSLNPKLSAAAEAIVAKAMARSADDRYAGAEALAADLEALVQGRPVAALEGRGFFETLQHYSRSCGNWQRRGRAPFEYRSKTTLFGLPLVHIHCSGSQWPRTTRTAKGIFALGDAAIGVVAVGGFAMGGLAMGGLSIGVIGFGGLAAGLLALGGVSLGIVALGGCAIGGIALGGLAIGGVALGGKSIGQLVLDGQVASPEMIEFWDRWLRGPVGWLSESLRDALEQRMRR